MGMTAVVDGQAASPESSPMQTQAFGAYPRCRAVTVAEVMTPSPRTITADRLAVDCVDTMEAAPKVSQLLVVDAGHRLVGALHLHDLFRARIV